MHVHKLLLLLLFWYINSWDKFEFLISLLGASWITKLLARFLLFLIKRNLHKMHIYCKWLVLSYFLKIVSKGMFGNCFFFLFSVPKNNFIFLRLKNLFGNSKWTENKNCSQNSICDGNWKHAKCCFQFLIFKSQWKHTFNLMNLSLLMS